MDMPLTLLIADDDDDQLRSSTALIEAELGHEVSVHQANSLHSALKAIQKMNALDLLMVDINFKERGGERAGLEIAKAAKERHPSTDVLVITGYSEELSYLDMLKLADLGVQSSSWIRKGYPDEAAAIALATHRARERRNSDPRHHKRSLRELWNSCLSQGSPQDQGRNLERFAADLFSQIPGMRIAHANKRLPGEEIDLVLENNIREPFWIAIRSPFILVECKNQSKRVEAGEVSKFWAKIQRHRNLARLGIMISVNGFTRGCSTHPDPDSIIILISGSDVNRFFMEETSVESWLRGIVSRGIL